MNINTGSGFYTNYSEPPQKKVKICNNPLRPISTNSNSKVELTVSLSSQIISESNSINSNKEKVTFGLADSIINLSEKPKAQEVAVPLVAAVSRPANRPMPELKLDWAKCFDEEEQEEKLKVTQQELPEQTNIVTIIAPLPVEEVVKIHSPVNEPEDPTFDRVQFMRQFKETFSRNFEEGKKKLLEAYQQRPTNELIKGLKERLDGYEKLKKNPNTHELCKLAFFAARFHRYAEALQSLRTYTGTKLTEEEKNLASLQKGHCYLRLGVFSQAIEYFKRNDTTESNIGKAEAMYRYDQANASKCLSILELILAKTNISNINFIKANLLVAKIQIPIDYKKAIDHLEKISFKASDTREIIEGLECFYMDVLNQLKHFGIHLSREKKEPQALEILDYVISKDELNDEAMVFRAHILQNQGKSKDAKKMIDRLMKIKPNSIAGLTYKADQLFWIKDIEAGKYYTQICDLLKDQIHNDYYIHAKIGRAKAFSLQKEMKMSMANELIELYKATKNPVVNKAFYEL